MTAQRLAPVQGRTRRLAVKLRFLALAGFYRDFCYVGRGETSYPMYILWADEMEISQVRVGQLVGRDSRLTNETDNWELFLNIKTRISKTFALLSETRGQGEQEQKGQSEPEVD